MLFHDRKKMTSDEWVEEATRTGKLVSAIKALRPRKRAGPWHVLCDDENFVTAPASKAAHRQAKVLLWQIPPKSPDLNPVERFWGWLRKRLVARDRADLKAKRPPLTKTAFRARVAAICKTKHAQKVAKNFAKVLLKVCTAVVAKRGAASGM